MSEVFKEGDILKIYHFTGARRKKHYIYKVIGYDQFKTLQAYNIPELMELGANKAHTTRINYILKYCQYEIIYRKFGSEEMEFSLVNENTKKRDTLSINTLDLKEKL